MLINSKGLTVATLGSLTLLAVISLVIPFYVLISRFMSNQVAIDWLNLFSATISTVSVAAFGALIALVLAAPLGALLSSRSDGFTRFTQRAITIGHGLPGVVVGLALVSIGSKLGAIYQTVSLLAFAYALLFLAKLVASMLRPTGFNTLATEIWSAASINRFNEAAPYALILVLVAAIPTFLISRPDKADRAYIQESIRSKT